MNQSNTILAEIYKKQTEISALVMVFESELKEKEKEIHSLRAQLAAKNAGQGLATASDPGAKTAPPSSESL